MANVYAKNLQAKDKEPPLHWVEEVPTMAAAEQDAKYIQERVDGAKWELKALHAPRNGEPTWDQRGNMREPVNEWTQEVTE